ncbi:hypothetical protein C2E23DRAFT_279302 [Lenzites betulinus]|nr:hypothetical protein C2E23DRAFT_279302 [Lenzites betulinus]
MKFFASVIPTIAVVAVCALGAIADGNSTASAALSDRVLPDEAYLQAILSIAFVYEASGSAICVRDYVGSLDEDIRSGREDPGMSRGVMRALDAHILDVYYAIVSLEYRSMDFFDDNVSSLLYRGFSQWVEHEQYVVSRSHNAPSARVGYGVVANSATPHRESMVYLRKIARLIPSGNARDVFYQSGREFARKIVGYASEFEKLHTVEPYSRYIKQTISDLNLIVENIWGSD